jgi:hypothetical protein
VETGVRRRWEGDDHIRFLHDLASDRVNPRKATAPVVTGVMGARGLRRLHEQ